MSLCLIVFLSSLILFGELGEIGIERQRNSDRETQRQGETEIQTDRDSEAERDSLSFRLSAIHENPCDYTISMKSSIIIRLVPVIGLVAQSFVMCALSIERSISTICASSYEKIREPTLGLALSGIAVLLSCFQNYMLIVRPINWDSIQFITTVRTRENADSYQVRLVFMRLRKQRVRLGLFEIQTYVYEHLTES